MMSFFPKTNVVLWAILLAVPTLMQAQDMQPEIGVFGGVSAYNGDLEARRLAFDQMHFSGGLFLQKEIYKGWGLRLGATFGKLSGADSISKKETMKARNLSFQSHISDFHLLVKYDFKQVAEATGGFMPYAFAGISVFHFDPYSRDSANRRVFLAPLSTEGEGLSAYPDMKPYKLTQLSIPFGLGIRYPVAEGIFLGVELQLNKTFTDYLDDVSKNYVDKAVLLQERGPTAVYFAYRGNELPGHSSETYPADGSMRGSPKANDWYYFAGLTLSIRLNGNAGGNAGLRQLRCPVQIRK